VVRDAPTPFPGLAIGPGSRTPVEILAHLGQPAILRRLADSPVTGENYVMAEIAIGRTGPARSGQRVEFG
jgi:hypothetical protein